MAHARNDLVRINIILPPEERDAFDKACRYGGSPRLSMNAVARELFKMFAAGKIKIDREHARKAARTAPPRPKR